MINFNKLTLRNFLSFGNNTTTVEFVDNGTVLVVGENLDNQEGGKNGVGKTSIINALVYAIYGKPVSNIQQDNLINNVNKQNLFVTCEFSIGSVYYYVERARKLKSKDKEHKGTYVRLFKRTEPGQFTNDDEITRDSISNTNKLLETIVGMPFELFIRIAVFSANHVPFLSLPVRHVSQTSQTSFIEELFDMKILTERADQLKAHIKETEQQLNQEKQLIKQKEEFILRQAQQIKQCEQRCIQWEEAHVEEIKDYENSIKEHKEFVSETDISAEIKKHEELNELKTLTKELQRHRESIGKEYKQYEIDIEKLDSEIEHLKENKCPYCKQQYKDNQDKIAELVDASETLKQQMSEKMDMFGVVTKEYDQLVKQKKQLAESIEIDDYDRLVNSKSALDKLEYELSRVVDETNPHLDSLDDLKDSKLENVDYSVVNNLQIEVDHQKVLLKILTKNDSFVRKVLVNRNVTFLNRMLQQYLRQIGLQHKVEFTDDLTCKISSLGREVDFGNLSNGQQARVNIALSLAFRDCLQRRLDRINLCMFDEVIDVGLDDIGVKDVARLLKKKARDDKSSFYIISHREVDNAFDKTMTVVMNKGFSSIAA